MSRRVFLAALVALLPAVCGCDSSPSTYEVKGTVTLDGKALADGDIIFIPEEKNLAPDAGKIKDGQFKFKAKAGKKTVEIRAVRAVPGKKGPMGNEPLLEVAIPAKYARTPLTAEVDKGGKNEFDFPLTSD